MRNYKFVVAMIVMGTIIAGGAFAQKAWYNSYGDGLNEKVFMNLGIGLGPTGPYGTTYNMGVPPLSFSVDFKLPVKVPITVGGIVIYSTWQHRYYNWRFIWHNLGLGARGMYHFNFAKNLDVYAGLTLGWVIQIFDGDGWSYTYGTGYGADPFFLWGLDVGARYFFTKKIGVYLELGYTGLQFASTGLAIKL